MEESSLELLSQVKSTCALYPSTKPVTTKQFSCQPVSGHLEGAHCGDRAGSHAAVPLWGNAYRKAVNAHSSDFAGVRNDELEYKHSNMDGP